MVSVGDRAGIRRVLQLSLTLLLLTGCSLWPAELNLSPLYRHRLDADGNLLEMDVLWPVFHYELTPEGGTDFRVRPIYRYLTEPRQLHMDVPAVEHQYLWPLGRIRYDSEETLNRLFPIWSWRSRLDESGMRDVDWYMLFPFFWGGTREDGAENYFGVFPLFGMLRQFLTYDRFDFFLFPLYLGLEKNEQICHFFLWPLTGYGYGEKGESWHRFLPFYSVAFAPSYERYSFLWPIFHWGTENLDTDDPVHHVMVWPPFGARWSDSGKVSGWTVLWPLFQKLSIQDRRYRLAILWPFYRYLDELAGTERLWQWWLWPLVARTIVEDKQWAWSLLWPIIWLREYFDPEGRMVQTWIVPVFWRVKREHRDGDEAEFVKVWPLYHYQADLEGKGDWSVLSPAAWRRGNFRGFEEAYGWIWTLAKGQHREADDSSFELIMNLYTTRKRGPRRTGSVPFLFNYESDDDGSGVLRLLQVIPISWGGSGPDETPAGGRGDR